MPHKAFHMKLAEHKFLPLVVMTVEADIFVNFAFGILFLGRIGRLVLHLQKPASENKLVVAFPFALSRFALRCPLPMTDKESQGVQGGPARGWLRLEQGGD